jgi:hypothetical protein
VALEPEDPEAPPADATIDWVRQLADVADRLAQQQPIAARATALEALRSVTAPERPAALTDDRLLRVAAASSKGASVGGRGEIYPRGLGAAEAIRLTLAGISAARLKLTPELLQARVAGRFPQAEPIPARPTLDAIVTDIDPALTWNGTSYGSTQSTSGSLLPTEHAHTILGGHLIGPAHDEIDVRLRASLTSSGYLTLTVHPKRQHRAIQLLAERYGVQIVNVTDVLLTSARDLAASSGVDWQFLLNVDALEPGSLDRTQLDRFVGTALDNVMPDLLANPEPLLLTEAAPLGRYHQQRWLSDLADLATPRPAARWVLLPHRDSAGVPSLDNHVPAPLGADGFLPLGNEFLDRIDIQESAS